MKKTALITLVFTVLLGSFFIQGISSSSQDAELQFNKPLNPAGKLTADPSWGNIPLYFIPNKGQMEKTALFYAKTSKYTLWLTKNGLVFDSVGPFPETDRERSNPAQSGEETSKLNDYTDSESRTREISRLMFVNANPNPEVTAINQTDHRVNYIKGKKSDWNTDIPTSKAALYNKLYKNIDLKVYGIEKQIEYDYIVKPGGSVSDIGFEYQNVKNTKIDSSGNLVITTRFGELKHAAPVSYQVIDGKKVNVESAFKKAGKDSYGFDVPEYNPDYDLIIDPLVLVYSTYLGGSAQDSAFSVALDSSGSAYLTGETMSSDFPTHNPFMEVEGGGAHDVYVTKFSSDGQSLVYSTYLGGSGDEYGQDIAVNIAGNAYVTGYTNSTNFPTQNPFAANYGGGSWDTFMTELSTDGQNLVYSTYLGGGDYDSGHGIAVDSSNNVYVTGRTASTDFPTQNPFMTDPGDANHDVFITKFAPDGQSLVFSTYLGGETTDLSSGIALDSANNIYVTGQTLSTDFPTQNPFMTDPGDGNGDPFVTKLSADGQSLIYSTYLGGSGNGLGNSIAVDSSGSAYVTGHTTSTDFPTQNPFMTNPDSTYWDVFVTKFSTDGQILVFSTYLGGGDQDYGHGIDIDNTNNVYVTGYTSSTDFPTQNPFMTDPGDGTYDVFVTSLSANGQSLLYSTYLGGGDNDSCYDIVLDGTGNAYVTGYTYSTDFPTQDPFMPEPGGGIRDVFVSKLSMVPNYYTISGTVTESSTGLENVVLSGLTGDPLTDASGFYTGTVAYGWSGTVTPTLAGYGFTPTDRTYANVTSDMTSQDYTAALVLATISGNITYAGSGSENVYLDGLPAGPYTDSSGDYSDTVDVGWSGIVVPVKSGFKFTPTQRTYTSVVAHQMNQDYTSGISFNPPNSYLVLPESIWALASGGGTWETDVQIIDRTGGSEVSVYFSPFGDSRRGPFVLWTGPGEDQSVKYENILETIGSLDTGYDYFNKVGAIEFLTQDVGNKIHVMARNFNGNFSKTFQAINIEEANTASITRQMIIQNLSSNETYRSAVGLFNTGGDTVTIDLTLRDGTNTMIGSTFTKTLTAYEFTAFNPFAAAGVPFGPGTSFENTFIQINPTSGAGKIICFGATTNNVSNDSAAHLALQVVVGYENSPGDYQVLPETIWAQASGGGTWVSEVQITDLSGGSEVSVYFTPYGGTRRGPFSLWTSPLINNSVKYGNILETLGGIETGYDYYGRVGTLEFVTQDSSHLIDITSRTFNGSYSKTFQGLNYVESNIANTVQQLMIQDLVSNDTYRSAVGCVNITGDPLTVEFSLIDADGNVIGSAFTRTIAANEFQSFNPFTQAGVPYPANSYDNVWIYINPTSGSGEIMCFGATSNNVSNDPAAHMAVHYK